MRARSPAEARALGYTTPTSSAPTRPGPAVTATLSTAPQLTPASSRARSTTAGRAARCTRLASSGTTPPNTLCTSCDRMMRLASSGRSRSPTSTAAEVSSHEVSMPRTTSATAPALALQGHGVGARAGRDSAGRLDGEPGVAARRAGAHEVRHHTQAVAGETLDPRCGAADAHLDALGDELPAGEARGRGRDGDTSEHTLGECRYLPHEPYFPRRDAGDAERLGVEGDRAVHRAGDARDLRRLRGHRLDPGEALRRADEAGRRRDRRDPQQREARVLLERDTRRDAHVPPRGGGDHDVHVPGRDVAHLHSLRALRQGDVPGRE